MELKRQLRRERRQLAAMPQRLLDDLGIDRTMALRESRRCDVPPERLFDAGGESHRNVLNRAAGIRELNGQ